MNKSLVTNLIALAILLLGYFLPDATLLAIGLFAVSGALTNWLAIYMLFEKIPGLYGSGVVPLHFEEFKYGIRSLMMKQFFTAENIERFLENKGAAEIDLSEVIGAMDLAPTYDGLIKTIEESSFGSMLGMIGGSQGLSSLKEPFIKRMKQSIGKIADSDQVQNAIASGLKNAGSHGEIADRIGEIIEKRLNELTPEIVKQIIAEMIRQHLGWLVVWGGVFGGLIGLMTTFLQP